ncbi:MAG: hypothetical protein ABSB82_01600 [Terriglobia bacterium]|jgi:tetratricopeptide (TPR) repeat protein
MTVSLRVWLAVSASVLVSVVVYARPAAPFGQAAGAAQASQKPAPQGQSGQAPATPGPSAAEKQAYQDLVSEATAGLDLDRVVALAQDYEKKYPDSPMLSYVYSFEASANMGKGDYSKAVDASQKSLKLNGDNLNSLLILANMLPQPQLMQGSDIDKQKRLDEAETDAKHALDLINQGKIPKQPNETDDAYTKRKNAISSEPHASLGMVHLQRATMGLQGMDQDELAKAAQEFKQSVEITDRPQPEHYYRLGEVYKHEKKIDDAIAAFSKASELSQGTGLQQYADKQVEELKKMQTPAKPPETH